MKLFLIILFYSAFAFSEPFDQTYKKGTGSRFELNTSGVKADLTLIVVDSTKDTLTIEYSIDSLAAHLTQQFKLKLSPGKRLDIVEGFQQAGDWKAPERIAIEKIAQLKSLGLGNFLLSEEELAGSLVGIETTDLPAGKTQTRHFKKSIKNGPTTEYWLSEEANPFKIVKIKSTGENEYEFSLGALLKNAKPKINPQKAVPATAKGNELFSLSQIAHPIP